MLFLIVSKCSLILKLGLFGKPRKQGLTAPPLVDLLLEKAGVGLHKSSQRSFPLSHELLERVSSTARRFSSTCEAQLRVQTSAGPLHSPP